MKRIVLFLVLLLAACSYGCAISPSNLNPQPWCSLDGHLMISLSASGIATTSGAGFGAFMPAGDRLCAPLAPTQVALPPLTPAVVVVAPVTAASGVPSK